MELDRHGLEVLDRRECLSLLGDASVGRVAVTVAALPAIFPVSFTLMDDDVVFRASAGSRLSAAVDRAVVAFEVDDVDDAGVVGDAAASGMEVRSGWSVLVVGPASAIVDPHELERAERLRLRAWAPKAEGHYVRIRSELVSGRRMGPRPDRPTVKFGSSTHA